MAESSKGGLAKGVKEPGTGIFGMKKAMAASQDKLSKEGSQNSKETAKAKDVNCERKLPKGKKNSSKKGSENSSQAKCPPQKGKLSKDNSENSKQPTKSKDPERKLSKESHENPEESAKGEDHEGKLSKENHEKTKVSANGKDLSTLGKLSNVDAENANFSVKEMEIDGTKLENSNIEKNKATAVGEASKKNAKKKKKKIKRKKHHTKNPTSDNTKQESKSGLGGLIFMCNSETKRDCFKYRVFGLPESKKDSVEKVGKGVKLFLFDVEKRILYGVYKARSRGGMNLVGEAFKGSNRSFPAQVKFRIQKSCVPLEECDFRQAIKDNYYGCNKFTCELSYNQVSKLVKLFRPLDARGLPKAKPGKDLRKATKFRSQGAAPRSSAYDNQGSHLHNSYVWQHVGHPQSRETLHLRENTSSTELFPTISLQDPVPFRESASLSHSMYPRDYGSVNSLNEIVHTNYAANPMERLQMREARLKALERMAYAPNPIGDSVMNKSSYLEGLYAEQGTLAPKTTIQHDSLYREIGNHKDNSYGSSYGTDKLGMSGAFPFDSSAAQFQFPRSYNL